MATMTQENLGGQRALVTGATSGIGRAVALQLARDGAEVVVHGRNAERGAETVQEITAAGGKASFVAADLSDAADVRWLASEVGDIDILVNNAGISAFGPTAEFDPAVFDEMFASNVRAPRERQLRSLPGGPPRPSSTLSGSSIRPMPPATGGFPAGALSCATSRMPRSPAAAPGPPPRSWRRSTERPTPQNPERNSRTWTPSSQIAMLRSASGEHSPLHRRRCTSALACSSRLASGCDGSDGSWRPGGTSDRRSTGSKRWEPFPGLSEPARSFARPAKPLGGEVGPTNPRPKPSVQPSWPALSSARARRRRGWRPGGVGVRQRRAGPPAIVRGWPPWRRTPWRPRHRAGHRPWPCAGGVR
jgi:NAD(P)-dependent dehydrogenase (short-subunit alcohol dehydrogenase family)